MVFLEHLRLLLRYTFPEILSTLWFNERKYHPYLINIVKWFAAGGYCLIHQTFPYSEVGAADVPSQVDRYLASRSPAAETAASWRCDLLIKFLTPYYNSQFCVSFHFAIDHETLRRLKMGVKITLTFSKIYLFDFCTNSWSRFPELLQATPITFIKWHI